MKQRGKKSAAKLSVVQVTAEVRPPAPDDLLPEEREMWDRITATRAPDFFDEATLPLLTEYCRLQSQVDTMAEQIENFDPEWLLTDDGVKRYKNLTSIRDQAQGRMIALARSMRLTQQARYVPDNARNRPKKSAKDPQRLWQRND